MALQNIFPELPGAEINPTAEERDAIAKKIAEGYLTPTKAVKMEPVPKKMANGSIIVDENGQVVYEVDENGDPIMAPAGYFDFSSPQDRILWAIQCVEMDDTRKAGLRSVLHKMEDDDKALIREAQVLALTITKVMSDHEAPPSSVEDLVAKLKAERPWRIPVLPFVQRHAQNVLQKTEPTFEELDATFHNARISGRLAKLSQEVAKAVGLAKTEEEKTDIISALETALSGVATAKG